MDNKLIATLLLVLLGILFYINSQPVGKEDIYINRLVYQKKDNTLFSGTLKVVGKSSYYFENFCLGVPCGKWSENENGGGVIQKGEYLKKDILSENTQKLIGSDIILIDHWQESELPSILYPQFLSIIILKDDAFFEREKLQFHNFARKIAFFVRNDTPELKYDYLNIAFCDAVRDGDKFYNTRFHVVNGELIELENQ